MENVLLSRLIPVLQAKLALATGVQHLYARNDSEPFVRVTDPDQIEQYLNTPQEFAGAKYYYIATQDPDARANEDVLSRLFGRAPQAIELTTTDAQPLFIIAPDVRIRMRPIIDVTPPALPAAGGNGEDR